MRELKFLIKICGLTTLDDARCAVEAGATHLGFVFYRESPRGVTAKHAARIVDKLPQGVRAVGVFVNEDPAVVRQTVTDCHLRAIQLHGDEAPGAFTDMPVPIWRAIRFANGMWNPRPRFWEPEYFLMDAAAPEYGGTGMRVEWTAAAAFAAEYRSLLAGGLTPSNVIEAIKAVRPLGVDVSSGVETTPGRKDHDKVRAFVLAAQEGAKLAAKAEAKRVMQARAGRGKGHGYGR